MYRWMGRIFITGVTIMWSHFQKLLELGRTFSDFWCKTVLHTYGLQTYQNVCTICEKESVLHSI